MISFIQSRRQSDQFLLLTLIRNHLGAWYWLYKPQQSIGEPFIHVEDADQVLQKHAKQYNLKYIIIDESVANCPELFTLEKADADV